MYIHNFGTATIATLSDLKQIKRFVKRYEREKNYTKNLRVARPSVARFLPRQSFDSSSANSEHEITVV